MPPQFVHEWTFQTSMTLLCSAPPRMKLAVTLSPAADGWGVTALEMQREKGKAWSAQKILDHHAHEIVGQFGTIIEAVAAAESYAREWATRRTKERSEGLANKCACDEIAGAGDARG